MGSLICGIPEILQAQGIAPLEQPIGHANAVGAGNKRAASRTNATPGPSNAKRSRQDDPPNAHSPRAAQSISPDAPEPPVKAEDVDGSAAAELDALLVSSIRTMLYVADVRDF